MHEPVARAHPTSRAGLRQLLLSGLEDVVAFDKAVVGYEHSSDGQVVVHLADGTSARGDVLVGADGSASAVRKQLLPEVSNAVASTNVFSRLAFRTVLRAADRWPLLHRALFRRPTVALRPAAERARGFRVAASARCHRSVR